MKIELRGVTKAFNERKVLDDASISFSSGFIAIVGKSGAGKTTLARLLLGECEPDGGKVLVDGRIAAELGDRSYSLFSYCPVDGGNVDSLTAHDNVSAVEKSEGKIAKVAEELRIAGIMGRKASRLSKGEAARVAVARALLGKGRCLLLDEPTANLDDESSERVFERLRAESRDRLVLLLTHDREMAETYCDAVYALEGGKLALISGKPASLSENEAGLSEGENYEGSVKPLFKAGFFASFKKKVPAILSILVLTASYACAYAGLSLMTRDQAATLQKAFRESKKPVIDCYDWRVSWDFSSEGISPKAAVDESEGRGTTVLSLQCLTGPSLGEWNIGAITASSARSLGLDDVDFSLYDDVMSAFKNDSFKVGGTQKAYYPIILSTDIVHFLVQNVVPTLNVGDVLPYACSNGDDIYRPQFVYCGSYSCELGTESGLLTRHAPAIVPDELESVYIEHEGIWARELERDIAGYCREYDNYVILNNLSDDLLTGIQEGSEISEGTVTKASLLGLPFYKEGETLPADESLVMYKGSLPKAKGEIMVPYKTVYERLCEEESPAESKGFFQDYPNGFPLRENSRKYAPLDSFRVVGYYAILGPTLRDEKGNVIHNDDGTEKRNSREDTDSPLILSDTDYQRMYDFYINEQRHSGFQEQIIFYTPKYLSERVDLLMSGQISQGRNKVIDTSSFWRNANSSAPFFIGLSGIIFAFGLLVVSIYSLTVGKELALLSRKAMAWGIPRKKRLSLGLFGDLGLVGVPLLLGEALGPVVLVWVKMILRRSVQTEAWLVCRVYPGILGILGISLALYGLLFLLLYASSKKKRAK